MKGFEAVLKKLKRLKQNAEDLAGPREISFKDLFTPQFMRQHSKVPSFEALLAAGGHRVESAADFKAIPDDAWERTVRAHTTFSSWREMQASATREYYAQRLKSGL